MVADRTPGRNSAVSAVAGSVGTWLLTFKTAPRGTEGEVQVQVASGNPFSVRWRNDENGIWIETSDELVGYDVEGERDEDGAIRYRLLRRAGPGEYAGLSFRRAGEAAAASATGAKKALRVRSQMPGKVVRIEVQAGDSVRKGDPLLVMEAMKMENEIRASHAGVVKTVHVSPGQAVETGADLILMEGA